MEVDIMSWINPKNAEKYPDPTAFGALKEIDKKERAERKKAEKKFKPLVYVCSPYAGDIENNVYNARRYCRFAYEHGAIPIAPHLHYPQFLDDEKENERADGLFMGIVLLNKCQELWVFGDEISNGMQDEIERAKKTNMVIKHFQEV